VARRLQGEPDKALGYLLQAKQHGYGRKEALGRLSVLAYSSRTYGGDQRSACETSHKIMAKFIRL